MSEYNYIGAALPRYDGEGQVTGKIMYADDFSKPGMLYRQSLPQPGSRGYWSRTSTPRRP